MIAIKMHAIRYNSTPLAKFHRSLDFIEEFDATLLLVLYVCSNVVWVHYKEQRHIHIHTHTHTPNPADDSKPKSRMLYLSKIILTAISDRLYCRKEDSRSFYEDQTELASFLKTTNKGLMCKKGREGEKYW